MKQKILTLLMVSVAASASAQGVFYGIARNSTTATETYLATVNPATGVVTNRSVTSLGPSINLTGAALDPYNNYFHFMTGTYINSVDLTTGNMINSVMVSNPIADSYFDNFRFNNSDTSLYGLARRVVYDTTTMTSTSEVYLAKINVNTGVISQLSATSVGQGFSLGGSAIDPYQKIYYYTAGSRLVGLDMYTGNIWSDVTMSVPNGIVFDNLAYSCADTGIYGLIRQNYYDTTYLDPMDSTNIMVLVDSTTLLLGKVNPATGVVSAISASSIASGGYSLSAGATIDPENMLYYYNNGGALIGVSLVTGAIVSQPVLSNLNGEHFELMRFQSNCIEATLPLRFPVATVRVPDNTAMPGINVYPNPAVDVMNIALADAEAKLEISDASGSSIFSAKLLKGINTLDVSNLPSGFYNAKIYGTVGFTCHKISKL